MAVVTPGRCGLYETTRELVAGLRALGVDSRLIDPLPKKNPIYKGAALPAEDRGALVADMDWAVGADIVVNHSGYDNTPIADAKMPVVHIAHGRPRSSFLSEVNGSTPIYSYWMSKNEDPRFAAIVTFWPEHKAYLEAMFPGKTVHVVTTPCDAKVWKLEGGKYGFEPYGEVNIVLTDPQRDDIDCFVPLNAAILFAREHPNTKVHVYALRPGKKGYSRLIDRLRADGNLGERGAWTDGLDQIYRAATMVLTANEIDTRTVREASCCGCPVVRVTNLNDGWQVPLRAAVRATEVDRHIISEMAKAKYDPAITAKQFKGVLDVISLT